MLVHVPFRVLPWNRAAIPPTVEAVAPVRRPLAPCTQASDPVGVRVVPLRPDAPWPTRRAHERVLSPFRAFPFRAMHLSRLMYAGDADRLARPPAMRAPEDQ